MAGIFESQAPTTPHAPTPVPTTAPVATNLPASFLPDLYVEPVNAAASRSDDMPYLFCACALILCTVAKGNESTQVHVSCYLLLCCVDKK
jgi:hypothetical protein